ncbi:hypothetical protein JNE12002_07770 [Escherichia coli]
MFGWRWLKPCFSFQCAWHFGAFLITDDRSASAINLVDVHQGLDNTYVKFQHMEDKNDIYTIEIYQFVRF